MSAGILKNFLKFSDAGYAENGELLVIIEVINQSHFIVNKL